MASITHETAGKINDGAKNGYQLDENYYLYHGEKTLQKFIDIDGNKTNFIKIKLHHRKNRQGGYNITITAEYNKAEGGFMVFKSGNFTKTFIINDSIEKSKNIKTLQTISEFLNTNFENYIINEYNSDDNKQAETDIFSMFASKKDISLSLDQLQKIA